MRRSWESEFEQRVPHLFVFLHRRRVDSLPRQQGPIERDRGQIDDRSQRALILRSDRLVGRMRLEAAYRDWPARGEERPELKGHSRQRAGSRAGGLLLLLRPAGGAQSGRVKLSVGRPGGANLKIIPFSKQENDAAAECGMHVRRRRPQNVVRTRGARQLSGVVGKGLRDLRILDHRLPLIANASRQRSDEYRDGKKDEKSEQFLRLRDREGVDRLDEKEIIGRE